MESKYVSACGLTCCDCLFYKKEFFEAARTMKRLMAEYGFGLFFNALSNREKSDEIATQLGLDGAQLEGLLRVFERMPDFAKVLDGFVAVECRHTCREKNGCSIGGTPHQCAALKCVNSKGLDGCWKCAEYRTCDKLAFQKAKYGRTVVENLSRLAREGTSTLKSRGNQYYEWQRRIMSQTAS